MKNKFDELYEQLIFESSLSRIERKIQNHSCGAISAFRNDDSYAINMKKHRQLMAYLLSKGYSITAVQGTYIENYKPKIEKQKDEIRMAAGARIRPVKEERHVSEKSFFVCNQKFEGRDKGELRNDLIKLGKHFNQDSVLIVPHGIQTAYLYGTNNADFPGFDNVVKVGTPKFGKTASAFISKLSGRPFAFHDKEEDLYDTNDKFITYDDKDILLPESNNGKWAMSIILKKFKTELGEG